MDSPSFGLSFEQILSYFREQGGTVRNKDVVNRFRKYLTDPENKDDARKRFREYVNSLAQSKIVNGEKVLCLRQKYLPSNSDCFVSSPLSSHCVAPISPQHDPRNSVGLPILPLHETPSRQPPPYRPPPPPGSASSPLRSPSISSPALSLDNFSLNSFNTFDYPMLSQVPQPPPRKRMGDRFSKSFDEDLSSKGLESKEEKENVNEKESLSVKERTQKFNRLASCDDELISPSRSENKHNKSIEKPKGSDEDDGASLPLVEPKKCVEWYVTASKGDFQELMRLAKAEPRLVNKKDPFTAYNVLHWGAKHGNPDIIKIFAGSYKVDVNAKTNGGYTPLHIAAQFGHKSIFKLLIEVYKANSNLRDYSGRTPEFYFAKEQSGPKNNLRKIKGRKKQSEKDLGFLRIGSLNVRVKKTTEAFSNFLGVGSTATVSPSAPLSEKVHKGWGSADNVNQNEDMAAPKNYGTKKKSKRATSDIYTASSTPTTPKQTSRSFRQVRVPNDSDSDTAAGFDSQWKN